MDKQTSNVITLRGATDIVTEFFMYSVNSILYQRGIYPPELFKRVSQYGLPMMVTTDEKISEYITNVMNQLKVWLLNGNIQKLVLVVKGVDSGEVLERWAFNCQSTTRIRTIGAAAGVENTAGLNSNSITADTISNTKSPKELTQEIQAIIRQITASVTFLPLLNEPCSFDLLVYADQDAAVPAALWEDSDACCIANGEDVKLRSFSTKLHKVDAMVSYKVDPDAV